MKGFLRAVAVLSILAGLIGAVAIPRVTSCTFEAPPDHPPFTPYDPPGACPAGHWLARAGVLLAGLLLAWLLFRVARALEDRPLPTSVSALAMLIVLTMVLDGAVAWARRGGDLSVRRADVTSVRLVPISEGPVSAAFVRIDRGDGHVPLGTILRWIPDPLPRPLAQGLCRSGGNVEVRLREGRTIDYGPCRRPDSIQRMRRRMLQILHDEFRD